MGNIPSFMTVERKNCSLEQSIGPIIECVDHDGSLNEAPHTVTRSQFDPRSPSLEFNRTPVMFEEDPLPDYEMPEDPRSPSVGITRTPMVVDAKPSLRIVNDSGLQQDAESAHGEQQDLVQVLNFTDLDSLNLSNIEEPVDDASDYEKEDPHIPKVPVGIFAEDSWDMSALLIAAASSTPAPSPVKSVKSSRRSNFTDENSLKNVSGKRQASPSVGALGKRVPFGDVNRPSLAASPRIQLQNKIKNNIRTEIHHRHGFKAE